MERGLVNYAAYIIIFFCFLILAGGMLYLNHSRLNSLLEGAKNVNINSLNLSEAQKDCLKEKGIDPMNLPKLLQPDQSPSSDLSQQASLVTSTKTIEDIQSCLKLGKK